MSDLSGTADAAHSSAAAHPSAALGAYAEALLRGRRVGVLGDATSQLAEQLLTRGARLVHVYDPDPGRLAIAAAQRAGDILGAGRAVRPVLAQLADDLGVRDGAFDVVLVPDLSLFDDAQDIVRRIRRLVSPNGFVVVSSPNPEAKRFLLPPSGAAQRALGYYDLFDAISLQFPEVRMLGQAPFVGYSIVDFAESEPEVSVDTSLLEEPEVPEWYLVIASDRPVDVDAYALIELPVADVARLGAAPQEPVTVPRPGPSDSEVALTEARTRISVLLTENETLRDAVRERAQAERAAEAATFRLAELQHELDGFRSRSTGLSSELDVLRSRSTELSSELESGHARNNVLEGTVRRLDAELNAERRARESSIAEATQARTLDQSLAAARKRISELEIEVARAAALEPVTLRSKEQQQARILALEAQRDELNTREQRANVRLRELDTQLATLRAERDAQLSGLRSERDAQLASLRVEREAAVIGLTVERDSAVQRAEAAEAQAAGLFAQLEAERAKANEEGQKTAPLEQEIKHLEDALRERGREVTRLRRELRETEQVGRELLYDLEQLAPQVASSSEGVRGGSQGGLQGGGQGGLQGGIQGGTLSAGGGEPGPAAYDLADRAARAEADLMAAAWKISRLEREISRQESPERDDPGLAVRELETALAAAQREIAMLRGAAGYDEAFLQDAQTSGVPAGSAPIEDALLVSQIERERLESVERP